MSKQVVLTKVVPQIFVEDALKSGIIYYFESNNPKILVSFDGRFGFSQLGSPMPHTASYINCSALDSIKEAISFNRHVFHGSLNDLIKDIELPF